MTKSKGFDWMPTIIMVGCFILVPGGGFFLGVLCSTLYYLGRFVLDLAADAEEEDKKQTKSKHTHTGPLLPKPRPNVTRNDS
jgi:hypothetical protein